MAHKILCSLALALTLISWNPGGKSGVANATPAPAPTNLGAAEDSRGSVVNAVIGDESWLAEGEGKVDAASEIERIQTHLHYVIGRLASKRADLDIATTERRLQLLESLQSYADRGLFPKNTRFPMRRPHFLDQERACAVGHLMIISGYQDLAERVNRQHAWDYLPEILDGSLGDEVKAWATYHGFTGSELAMIQPQYGFEPIEKTPLTKSIMASYIDSMKYSFKLCLRESLGTVPTTLSVTLRAEKRSEAQSGKRQPVMRGDNTPDEWQRSIAIDLGPQSNDKVVACIHEPLEYFFRNFSLHYLEPKTPIAATCVYAHLNEMSKARARRLRAARAKIKALVRAHRETLNRCLSDKHPDKLEVKITLWSMLDESIGFERHEPNSLRGTEACLASALELDRGRVPGAETEPFELPVQLTKPTRPAPYQPPSMDEPMVD